MDQSWDSLGRYTPPNRSRYPWQWLWDSCFHAIVWSSLGDERAAIELETVFRHQHRDGMVPHMGYQSDPSAAQDLWRRDSASSITQPPMYGHALAVLARAGYDVDHLVAPAAAGLWFLLRLRRARSGGVVVVHPWESGVDDSPRWAGADASPIDRSAWGARKVALVRSLEFSRAGSSTANPNFSVVPAGFNALVAFNCRELASVTGDTGLLDESDHIVAAIEASWDEELATWIDRGPGGAALSRVRTLDALLPVLVTGDARRGDAVLNSITDGAFAGAWGPRGLHPDEPAFDPSGYWRGGAWPPLTYLFWLAATRRRPAAAPTIAATAVTAAESSGFAEYLDPETGGGLGAIPQGWACLPLAMGGVSPSPAANRPPECGRETVTSK
jgi:hypothetical protein